ncbi:MAG: hypothetical protein PGN09_07560 [Sphingomonas fennica]
MSLPGHSYKDGSRGRSITTRPGVGGQTVTARLRCSACATTGNRNFRSLMPPEQIDKKFAQAGWSLDPHVCPDCRATRAREKTMGMKPTAAAMKAQAAMFRLLTDHFDIDDGAYAAGWSDEKIATDTGLAAEAVAEFRRAGFGEIKEAAPIRQLRADIAALESLAREQHNAIIGEIASLRGQLAKLTAGKGA